MLPISPTPPPTNHRRAPRANSNWNAPAPSDPVSAQRRALEALAKMQASRPLAPPGKVRR